MARGVSLDKYEECEGEKGSVSPWRSAAAVSFWRLRVVDVQTQRVQRAGRFDLVEVVKC